MKWRSLFETMAAAAIGGAVMGGAEAVQAGVESPKKIGTMAAGGALLAIAALWKQKPNAVATPPLQPEDKPKYDPNDSQ